jgi:hypothetical protein
MYDCDSDGAGIPANPQAVAGYTGGGNFDALAARFPHAQHFSIIASQALAAQYYPADCLDVERGDALPSQAPGWVQERIKAGAYRPCVYASQATYMPEVVQALAHLERSSYRLWIAHWGQPAVVPAGYDAIQYATYTDLFDESVCLDDFFAPKPPPKPKTVTLTAAQKQGFTDSRADLLGISTRRGALPQAMVDQIKLCETRCAEALR